MRNNSVYISLMQQLQIDILSKFFCTTPQHKDKANIGYIEIDTDAMSAIDETNMNSAKGPNRFKVILLKNCLTVTTAL